MSSFFEMSVRARLGKHLDRNPLLKLEGVLKWEGIGKRLDAQRSKEIDMSKAGRAHDRLKMFKAVLLGQWHSLSDPELEKSLLIRIDFVLFCGFDEDETPDETTLCRFRNWLMSTGLMPILLEEINAQLKASNLRVERSKNAAIIDATIIETAGGKTPKHLEVNEEGEVSQSKPSKDVDARWVKKDGRFYLGYKLHARVDGDGYFEQAHLTPANAHETKHVEVLLDKVKANTRVYADKGYASVANRALLGLC